MVWFALMLKRRFASRANVTKNNLFSYRCLSAFIGGHYSFGARIKLHHAEKRSFRVFAVGQPAHSGNSHFGNRNRSAVGQRPRERVVQRLHGPGVPPPPIPTPPLPDRSAECH